MISFKNDNWIMSEIDGRVIVQNRHRNRKETIPFVYKNTSLYEVYNKFKEMGVL